VDCQVVHICDCVPARLPKALAELPKSLDETYERALQRIKEANWEFAYNMFQFVSVAYRPLRVKELADLLAFDFEPEARSIPKFDKDWRLEDPVYAVLSTCTTLLAVVNDGGSPLIQFSHFSVKEFLTSPRLSKATDFISRRYHISMTPAHTLVARACLGILLHLDKDVNRDSPEDAPLAEYAAEHWVDHAQFEDISRSVEDGTKKLSDPSKPHFAVCVWIYGLAVSIWPRMTRNETLPPLPHTSLHYAASWGLHPVVEFLITEHSQDVSSPDFTDGATPLHLASRNGHVKAVSKLMRLGADVNARNNYGLTPLHLASDSGQVDIARGLIVFGADLNARNNYGLTPLHLASDAGQVDTARVLMDHGVDVNARNNYGLTPLHLASNSGQVDIARMLIERCADASAQNKHGQTPLHLASDSGQVDIARILIERGADVSAQNKYGQTPLHLASNSGQVDIARMLIERGAVRGEIR
jgi:ankyrin repeat protein